MKTAHSVRISSIFLIALFLCVFCQAHCGVIGDGRVALPVVVWVVDENGKAIKGAAIKLLEPPSYKTLLEGFTQEAIREAESVSLSNSLGFGMVYLEAPYSVVISEKNRSYKVLVRGSIQISAEGRNTLTVDLKKEIGEHLASSNVAPYLTVQLKSNVIDDLKKRGSK
jgi:hypothetical protein